MMTRAVKRKQHTSTQKHVSSKLYALCTMPIQCLLIVLSFIVSSAASDNLQFGQVVGLCKHMHLQRRQLSIGQTFRVTPLLLPLLRGLQPSKLLITKMSMNKNYVPLQFTRASSEVLQSMTLLHTLEIEVPFAENKLLVSLTQVKTLKLRQSNLENIQELPCNLLSFDTDHLAQRSATLQTLKISNVDNNVQDDGALFDVPFPNLKVYDATEQYFPNILQKFLSISSLQELHLPYISRHHKINETFANLKKLENLVVLRIEFLADVSVLQGGFNHLQRLVVSIDSTDLNFISHMKKLTHLEVSFSPYLQDISAIAEHVDLKVLCLSFCGLLKDISPISKLHSLEVLDVSGCSDDLSCPLFLADMPSLIKVHCDFKTHDYCMDRKSNESHYFSELNNFLKAFFH